MKWLGRRDLNPRSPGPEPGVHSKLDRSPSKKRIPSRELPEQALLVLNPHGLEPLGKERPGAGLNLEPTAGVEPASSSLRVMTWPAPHAGIILVGAAGIEPASGVNPLRIRQVP